MSATPCLLKRILPCALTLAAGVSLVNLSGHQGRRPRPSDASARTGVSSKTWAVIHSFPSSREPVSGLPERVRVKLDADGTVSEIERVVPSPAGLSEDVFRLVRGMKFTPAAKDDTPVSVWTELYCDRYARSHRPDAPGGRCYRHRGWSPAVSETGEDWGVVFE